MWGITQNFFNGLYRTLGRIELYCPAWGGAWGLALEVIIMNSITGIHVIFST